MSFLQKVKSSKTYIWAKNHQGLLLGGLIVILIIIIIFLWNRDTTKYVPIDPQNHDLLEAIKVKKDENGKLWAELRARVVSEAEARARADSMAKALGIKPKYIKGQDMYVYSFDTVYKNIPTTRVITKYKDTAYQVERHDAWNDIVAVAGKNTGSIQHSSRDTLWRVETVKSPLIGKTTRTTLIRNANPSNKIVEGFSYSVKEKDVWLAIGPSAGVTFDGKGFKPYIGIGVTIPIIKFRR